MNLADCYRILGLKSGASSEEIKAAYRRLARQYHPDVNPGNQRAKEKFIEVTEAYKQLLSSGAASGSATPSRETTTPNPAPNGTTPTASTGGSVKTTVKRKSPPIQFNPNLSPADQQLKASSYKQLQQFLLDHRYPRAIALVEGLVRRIPQDPEITQWQAIVYQRWGHHLIGQRQFDKARIYLKKALKTDPHNRSLWAEVEKDFRYLEQIF